MISEIEADEVQALARKLEVRARRTRDRDLARAGTLLRVLLAVSATAAEAVARVTAKPASPADHAAASVAFSTVAPNEAAVVAEPGATAAAAALPAAALAPADSCTVKATAKAGGEVRTLAKGERGPFAIAVDPGGVYWSNLGDGTIRSLRR